jgi:4,5-DOPA dioxygenase extradiol
MARSGDRGGLRVNAPTQRAPALFLGHGTPMNALESNRYTAAWRELAAAYPRPRAILAVSAHWYAPGLAVTADHAPRTIHDFRGFPTELYAVRYPAPGAPDVARPVVRALQPRAVEASLDWGLDHGTWSVLIHMYPDATIPVIQLRIDAMQAPEFHFSVGRELAPLRDEGVMIVGSGNVVHNLARINWDEAAPGFRWAVEFEAAVRARVLARNHGALIDYDDGSDAAQLSVPTPEHYLPLLYVVAAQHSADAVSVPLTGIDRGSISMLAVAVG